MSKVPPHRLFVYQKPRVSQAFLNSYKVANYKHKLSWHGCYDTASCNIICSPSEAEFIFQQFIGNAVTVHVDDPVTPIFDGYISSMTYEVGNIVFRRSLDEMANRAQVTFYNADSPAAQKTEITTVVDNTASQAIYGIKETNVDAGVHYNNADKTHKTVLRDTLKSVLAWPQVSVSNRAGGGVLLSLEIKGWYHVLDWTNYEDALAVTAAASEIFRGVAVGTRRSANIDFICAVTPATGFGGLVDANLSFNISSNSKTGQTHLQYLQSIAEAGDGVSEWVWGFTPIDFNYGSRRVYYRAANTDITYTCKALRDTGTIFDLFGKRIDPWRVSPDNGIRVTDVLIGYDQAGDNPSESYIKFISYDAESQQVSWQSSDDNTMEGAFNLRKYFKRHGQRFGAPVRQLV